MLEFSEFDNVTRQNVLDYVDRGLEDYYSLVIPEWTLPYFVNGELEGYNDEELANMKKLEEHFYETHNIHLGDYFIPLDDAYPSFSSYNDVDDQGAMCYLFFVPRHFLN